MTAMVTIMASPCFSFLSKILLCVSFFCLMCIVHGDDEITVPVSSFFPSPNCNASTFSANSTLKLVHKQGPCSPFFKGEPVNQTQLLLDDVARVKWIQSTISGANANDNPKNLAVSLEAKYGPEGANFLVTIGLGTPKKELALMFDTGSSLTWTHCNLARSPYNPTQSSSYANISFSDPSCKLLQSATGQKPHPIGSACYYTAKYQDRTFSEGIFGIETLTVSPNNAITHFKFGCSRSNVGFAKYIGILGLARDPISFLEQSATKYGKYFSYCLPPSMSSTGYLTFGKGNMPSTSVKFTPLSTIKSGSDFYGIKIKGISVNGKDLGISSNVFSKVPTNIDSGTAITRLPSPAYKALRLAFEQAMSKYKKATRDSLLDTCYDLSGSTQVTIPTIKFTFDGPIEVELDSSGVLYSISPSQTCLAFAEISGGLSIYGNVQQRSFEVVYDVAGGRIGFRAKGCS